MIYLLDSNVCIRLLNDNHPLVSARLKQHTPAEISLCSVVKTELIFGAWRSGRVEANLQRLKLFFEPLPSLPFDDVCAEHYAKIRADLTAQGQLIGANDLLIAAIARANQAVLVSNNTREFSRVSDLNLEDWEV